MVALTVPTWASNFASDISQRKNKWRASRSRRNCAPKQRRRADVRRFARKSRPQQKVGSVRGYGCDYTSARLLYWAYYVPADQGRWLISPASAPGAQSQAPGFSSQNCSN